MYELALMLDPACAEAHNNLGVVHKERENMEVRVREGGGGEEGGGGVYKERENMEVCQTGSRGRGGRVWDQ